MASYYLQQAPNHQLNDLKLMKLLYLAERDSLRQYTASISGDAFFSMPKGPILSNTYRLMTEQDHAAVWNEAVKWKPYSGGGVSENTLMLVKPVDVEKYLSKAEIEILARVWGEHKGKGKWTLVELTHFLKEWDKTAKDMNTSIPITVEDIFRKGLNEDPASAAAKASDIAYYDALEA